MSFVSFVLEDIVIDKFTVKLSLYQHLHHTFCSIQTPRRLYATPPLFEAVGMNLEMSVSVADCELRQSVCRHQKPVDRTM